MKYTAPGTAALMLLAAQRLDENPDTGRRAAELALPATRSADVHVASSGISDPTYEQATSDDPAIASYLPRWRAATTALQGWVGSPLSSALRASAPLVSAGRQLVWANPYLIDRIGTHCDEVIRLIDLCRPMDLKAAAKALRTEQKAAQRSSDCEACGAPTGPALQEGWSDTTLVSGLCRPGCYETEKKQVQRGIYIDRTTFIARMRAGIERGEIDRPASPYWRTAVIGVQHEGDVA